MSDAFISYSRRDADFVARLQAGLEARGKQVWLDTRDIPPTAKWRDEIRAGVDAADAFVFVLSPASLASEVCREELGLAVEARKRLVPVLHAPVDDAAVPSELAAHNWITASDGDDLDQALDRLVAALDTDLDWAREHTRLLVAAREWQAGAGDDSLLPRDRRLEEAERWLHAAGAEGKKPVPTPLHFEFVEAGRRHAARQAAARRRRSRIAIAVLSVAFVITAVAGVVALLERNEANDQRTLAVSRELAARADAALASDPHGALRLAVESVDERATPEAEASLDAALVTSRQRSEVLPGGGAMAAAGVQRDGTVLAVGADGAVWRLQADGAPTVPVALASGEARTATASADGTVLAFDDGESIRVVDGQGRGRTVAPNEFGYALSDDGRTLAIGDVEGGLLLAPVDGRGREEVLPVDGAVGAVALSPDGQTVAAGSTDGTVRVLPRSGTGRVRVLQAGDGPVTALAFSGDGGALASAGQDGTVRVWTVATGAGAAVLRGHDGPVVDLAFGPDGRFLASAGDDGTARVWDLRRDEAVVLRGHLAALTSVAFSRDGRVLVTAGDDGTVRRWDVSDGERRVVRDDADAVLSAELTAAGTTLVTSAGDGAVRLRPLAGAGRAEVVQAPLPAFDAAASPDGRLLVTAGAGADLWTVGSPGEPRNLQPQGDYVYDAAWAPDGSRFALASSAGLTLRLSNGEVERTQAPQPAFLSAAFSPDGRRVAAGAEDGVIRIWSLDDPAAAPAPRELAGHVGTVQDVAFSPDGRLLVSAGEDGTIRVWDPDTGREVQPAMAAEGGGAVYSAAFSPDGRSIVTAGGNGVVEVWDRGRGIPRVSLRRHEGLVRDALIAPDGHTLVSVGDDMTVRVLECEVCLPLADRLALARARAG